MVNQDNAQTLDLFKSGQIDGAWLPEPWASRLVIEAGGKVLVDETTLWPDDQFPTTILIVAKKFLDAAPGHRQGVDLGRDHGDRGDRRRSGQGAGRDRTPRIGKLTGKKLSDAAIDPAFKNIKIDLRPAGRHLQRLAANMRSTAGLLKTTRISTGSSTCACSTRC